MPLPVRIFWGIIFRPFQVIWIFVTCFKFLYYLKLPLKSKIIWGAIFRYIGRLRPALSSSFLLRVVCRLAGMQNESVMNAWPELDAKRKPLEYAKTTMNHPPPQEKDISTFCTSSGRGGGVQSFTQRSAHTRTHTYMHTYIYIYAYGCLKEPHFRHFMRA